MDEAQMLEVARLSTAVQSLVDTYLASAPGASPEGARAALSLVLAPLQARIRGTAEDILAGEPYPDAVTVPSGSTVTLEYGHVDIDVEEPSHGYWEAGDHG